MEVGETILHYYISARKPLSMAIHVSPLTKNEVTEDTEERSASDATESDDKQDDEKSLDDIIDAYAS